MLNIPTCDPGDELFRESPLSEENLKLRQYIGKLEHDMFFLYVYLTANDCCDEACEFLECHEETRVPFRSQF